MTSPLGKLEIQKINASRERLRVREEYLRDVPEKYILKLITDTCDKSAVPYMRNYNSKVVTIPGGERILAKLPALQKGKPDVTILCREKLTLWVETKAPTGKLSEDQQRWKYWIIQRGHEYHAPRTIEEAHAVADRIIELGR